MTTAKHPTGSLVAVAWLGSLASFSPAMVATRLPRPDPKTGAISWAETGFLTARAVAGAPNIDVPMRHPIYQVDFWATTATSKKPPLGKAEQLSEVLFAELQDEHNFQGRLTLPTGYAQASVKAAYFLGEPRPMWTDASDYARWMVNLAVHWVEVTTP